MIPKMNINKLDMKDIIIGILILILIYLTFNNVLQKMENFVTVLDLENLTSPVDLTRNQIDALQQDIISDLTTGEIDTLKVNTNLCIKDKCLKETDIIKIINDRPPSA
jgi:hypothetical protein